jgi:hypothetical protein
MTPQTVNAVNLPLQDALNFPAAILQPPFFDPLAPAAANYGAIGSVIGHEISHTFDTEGSTFDAQGRLRNWWTPEDLAHFEAATAELAAQYDTYKPFPDISVNGKQTLAENIAVRRVSGLRWLPCCARRKDRAGAGWVYRRPAILHRVWPELGIEDARSGVAAASDDRSSCARAIPGRYRAQC